MQEIRGQNNIFEFLGIYNKKTGSFSNSIPFGKNVVSAEIDDDGNAILYAEDGVKLHYDAETGSLYLIEEVR
jgi:hypothetical protein